MSTQKRKYQRRQMPTGAQFDPSRQDITKELEMAHNQAVLASPKAQAILAQLMRAKNNRERLEASLLLQDLVRGDASLLQSPTLADNLEKMRETAEARDRAEEDYANDQEGFVEGTIATAEKNKMVGDQAERMKVQVTRQLQDAIAKAKAKRAARHLQLDWQLDHEPKVEIQVAGIWETVRINDGMQNILRPEIIRILHRTFVLKPGANTVPITVANRYEQILISRREQDERKAAMSKEGLGMEAGALELAQRAIDDKYRVGREAPALT